MGDHVGGTLYHYRDYLGHKIKAIIVLPNSEWCVFETKLGANQIDNATDNLLTIQCELEASPSGKPPVVHGVICGMSNATYLRPDRVFVVPITAFKH